MTDNRRPLICLFAVCLAASACGNASQRVLLQNQFSRVPISTIALDDYANDGTLAVAPGTEFGLQLSGGGWTFTTPAADAPFQLISGPADWLPETGVRVHFSGNWSAPTPNAEVDELFREMHRSSSGVVRLQGVTHTADGAIYSYAITGKGGCAYDFTDLDGPALGDGYTIGFDVP